MDRQNQIDPQQKQNIREKLFWMISMILLGILLDILGKKVAGGLNIPLYLDSVGYMLIACVGGYLPGIVVGYFSNLITGVEDISNAYYGVISVLIVAFITYLTQKGVFRKAAGYFAGVFGAALIGGGVGGLLTWLLYGFDPKGDLIFPFLKTAYENGSLGLFSANMIMNLLLDLVDKAICLAIVMLFVTVLPKSIKEKCFLGAASYGGTTNSISHNKQYIRKRSLRAKVVLIVGSVMTCIAAVAGVICFFLYDRATVEEHKTLALGVANLAAGVIDGDRVDMFLEQGEEAPDYRHTEGLLYKIRESSPDIEYVYVYRILPDGCHVVFDLDTEEVTAADPGEVVEFDSSFAEYIPDLLNGNEIEPIITNDTFGWLLTVYRPVYDSEGKVSSYACVDISMNQVKQNEISFISKEAALFLGFIIVVLVFTLWIAEYRLLLPLNTMADAAGRFAYDNEEDLERGVERMQSLQINTGDEIEHLYKVFTKTMEDTVDHISEVNKKNKTISDMQNNLIYALADMVESRDESTGDHIKKTAAYVQLICDRMKLLPAYRELFTEEYIDNVVHSAPLHDVGKIKISDVILNKPGRLTDEEFEIMKTHTTAGKEIIDTVIETVTESGYLDEAKNMATYHHEKWNGSGYPYGLSGEDIPLSARIMAVADVFDALVSRRCYKEPFSFEKAMEIIKEGAGQHFDPTIVAVFAEAEAEVREISDRYM